MTHAGNTAHAVILSEAKDLLDKVSEEINHTRKGKVMNQKSNIAAVIGYITWIGFFIAFLIRDRNDRFTAQHLNQALVLNIAEIIGGALAIIPIVGWIAGSVVTVGSFVLTIMGIYRAATWNDTPLPFAGEIHLID